MLRMGACDSEWSVDDGVRDSGWSGWTLDARTTRGELPRIKPTDLLLLLRGSAGASSSLKSHRASSTVKSRRAHRISAASLDSACVLRCEKGGKTR
eukprot:3933902-Rhodomonas_salina.1